MMQIQKLYSVQLQGHINGFPRSNTINNFVRPFIYCQIERCIIGEFSGKQLEILISNMFAYKGRQENQ